MDPKHPLEQANDERPLRDLLSAEERQLMEYVLAHAEAHELNTATNPRPVTVLARALKRLADGQP